MLSAERHFRWKASCEPRAAEAAGRLCRSRRRRRLLPSARPGRPGIGDPFAGDQRRSIGVPSVGVQRHGISGSSADIRRRIVGPSAASRPRSIPGSSAGLRRRGIRFFGRIGRRVIAGRRHPVRAEPPRNLRACESGLSGGQATSVRRLHAAPPRNRRRLARFPFDVYDARLVPNRRRRGALAPDVARQNVRRS